VFEERKNMSESSETPKSNGSNVGSSKNKDKEYLKLAARAMGDRLPDNTGFILLTCPFAGQGEARCSYISNISREEAVALMKEMLIRFDEDEDWMKHIN